MKSMIRYILAAFVFGTMSTNANQVKLNVQLAKPVLEADTKQTTFVKVGLTGFELASEQERAPVNVSIVFDKSGSMGGNKIVQARKAAKMAIDRLNANDIVSVVLYDSTVKILVPATKVSDKNSIFAQIDQITAGGSTALFAGMSKGADEVRKFIDKERLNRIFLISDGQANVGPKTPQELGELGMSLAKEGISVTTIGLGAGYNEDLMAQLALKSDGRHSFVEDATQLAQIFNEDFGEMLSVVAQEVEVVVDCKPGIRPVRLLGREGDISGQKVVTAMNQIYSKQEQYFLLEVEVPAAEKDSKLDVATVSLAYLNMGTKNRDRLSSSVAARFTNSKAVVNKSLNKDVMISCVTQIALENNQRATALRDQGRTKEAEALLRGNVFYLYDNAKKLDSEFLRSYGDFNGVNAGNLNNDNWAIERKKMRYQQSRVQQGSQSLRGAPVHKKAPSQSSSVKVKIKK